MAIIQKRYAHLNQSDSGSLHRKLDATSAYITGSLQVQGEITGSSPVRFDSTLLVQGVSQHDAIAKFGNTAQVLAHVNAAYGATEADFSVVSEKGLLVSGSIIGEEDLSLAGNADINGNLSVQGSLSASLASRFYNDLAVEGTADMRDVLPNADLSYDLGSASQRWAELHAGTAAFTNLEADYLDVAVTASVAQLTGSAGAVFSAGDVLVQAGKVSASLDLEAGGQLVVAGNADLNGQLDVALAAEFHSTLSASGNAQLGGTLTLAGNADLNGQLDVALAAEFHSTLSASGNAQLGGTLALAGAGTFASSLAVNGSGVALNVANSASIGGDLTVAGDFIVQGEQVILDTVTLQVEDKNIEIAKVAAPTDITANGAGITIKGASDHTIVWYNDRDGGVDAFSINDHWLPEADMSYDLGTSNYRWRELNLSGDANVGGALDVAGAASVGDLDAASIAVAGAATFGAGIAVTGTGSFSSTLSASAGISGASFSTDGSLTVQGAADLNGGLDVIGAVSASQGVTAASFTADGLGDFGSLDVTGAANIGGGLDVVGAISASAALEGASVAVDGLGEFGSLDVSGNAQFTSLTASVGAEIQGPLSASSLVVAGNADFNGTATFNGTFAVPGTGSFGALVVGGINMSPISSSSPVSTVDAGTATLLTQALVADDMAKFEIEVVARGRGTEMGDNGNNAAAWKISVAAMHDGANIQAAATELSKEFFGPLGANLDVDIETSGNNIIVKAKGTASASTVFWDAQIVKKMVMNSANGARKY